MENFDELQGVAEETDSYYKLGASEGAPAREKHLCWGLSGVPEELQEINSAAQTHYFIGGESRPAPTEKEEEMSESGAQPSPMRPRSARPYDRLRRPLSSGRERPHSPVRDSGADFAEYNATSPWYSVLDHIQDTDHGMTPMSSRPISAAGRPVSAVSRPKSAASVRPKSAASGASQPLHVTVVQRPRPSSAAAVSGTTLHVRLPSQARPYSAPSPNRPSSAPSGRRQSWLYRKASNTEEAACLGFGGKFVPPRRPPAGPWTRKCRENGAEVLRHKLTSCLLMSHALPF